jgi:hypothetical protein
MPDLKRELPSWLDAFMEYTDNSEPPMLFRKWVGISCLAAALMRKVRVDWGTTLTWYPNLYIVLVGPSATGKGTAMAPGLKIINKVLSIKMSAQATSLQALISHLKDNNLTDFNPETGEHAYHSSITVYSEEFTVFLGYHNNELMSTLCDWYDCKDNWTYDTIKRSKEKINGVWVNLIGGTTPDLIRSSLPYESIGGGLTSRIIFVYEEKQAKLVTFPTETLREKQLFDLLVRDLEKVSLLSGSFSWTEDFMHLWDKWCRNAVEDPPFHDRKFDGYNGRRRVHLMKLAMIMSASYGRHDLVLTEDDLEEAAVILNEVEQKMALTFKGVGKSDIAELIFRANIFLKTSQTDEIPYAEFAKHFESDADKETLDRITNTLEATNTAKVIIRPGADSIIKIIK